MKRLITTLPILFILIAIYNPICLGLDIEIDTNNIQTDIDPDGQIKPLYQGMNDFWWEFFGYGLNNPDEPDDELGIVAENFLKEINLSFYRINLPLCKIYSEKDKRDLIQEYEEAANWMYNDRIAEGKTLGEEITTAKTVTEAENADYYNWQNTDELFTSLANLGVEPLIQITTVPASVKPLFDRLGNPIDDRLEVYAAIIKHIVMHYTQGWPDGTGHYYDVRYFEIWNEPNHRGDAYLRVDQYYALYQAVATAIKEINPDLQIGGPALASIPGWKTWLGGNSLVHGFLDLCRADGYDECPLDFLSIHGYSDNPQFFKTLGTDVRSIALKHGYGNDTDSPFPLILSEWGSFQSLLAYVLPTRDIPNLESNWAAIHAVKSLLNIRTAKFDYAAYWMSTDASFNYSGAVSDDFNIGRMGLLRSWKNADVNHVSPYENKRKKLYFAFKAMDLLNDSPTEITISTHNIRLFESTNLVKIAGENSDKDTITAVIVNSARILSNTLKNITVNGLTEGDAWTVKVLSLNADEDLSEIAMTQAPIQVDQNGILYINNWNVWLPKYSITVIRFEKQG